MSSKQKPLPKSLPFVALLISQSCFGASIFSDDFDSGALDAAVWDTGTIDESGSGSFETTADGTLGLVTPGSVTGVRPMAGVQALTTVARGSSWTLSVTMNLADLADLSSDFAGGDGVAMTVQVSNALESNDRLELNFAAINFGSPGYAVRSAERSETNGSGNEPIIPISGSTASTATLILTYDGLTEMASSAYQVNGGPLTRFGFDSDLSSWAAGMGDDFTFSIEGSSGNFSGGSAPLDGSMDLSNGEAAFDSISLTDEHTTLPDAVPEPSAGLLASLAMAAAFRRRVSR